MHANNVPDAGGKYLAGENLRVLSAPLGLSPSTLAKLFRNRTLTGRRQDRKGRTILKVEPSLTAAPGTWVGHSLVIFW